MEPICTKFGEILLLLSAALPQESPGINNWYILLCTDFLHGLCVLFGDLEFAVRVLLRGIAGSQELKPLVRVDGRRCEQDDASFGRKPLRPRIPNHMNHVAEVMLELGQRNVLLLARNSSVICTKPNCQQLYFRDVVSVVTLSKHLRYGVDN